MRSLSDISLPPVFAHTALTDLTPVVTEEPVQEYALTEFRSLEANMNRPGDLQSLGLRTTVDYKIITYPTWVFQVERNERWGEDVAYIDVDVIDGYILWSQTFVGNA